LNGGLLFMYAKLHQKYGNIVRVLSNKLSFIHDTCRDMKGSAFYQGPRRRSSVSRW
ncbi:hypothetical protein BDR22DRAFT_805921, partial [Usnea florida]